MIYIIKEEKDLKSLKNDGKYLEVGDILIHKNIPFYKISSYIAKYFPNVKELFPVTAGTTIYTKYGYNTSVVKEITDTLIF